MKRTPSDEELIRQYLSGQADHCFEILYTRYASKVYRRCLSMTQKPEQAEDFTHDIFLKVFDKLRSFQQRSSFSTWLYSITYNYCTDHLRLAKRLNMVVFDERLEWHLPDTQEAVVNEDDIQLREQALAKLPATEQTFLRQKYEEGMSMKDLAGIYALEVDVVKMRLKRSRDKVQRFYARHLTD